MRVVRKDKPTHDYKTPVEIELERQKIIGNYLDGGLQRFLRKHYKQSRYEKVYSELIPNWEKELKTRRAIKWLKKQVEFPKHFIDVINIVITLEKYYGFEINRKNTEVAYNIWDKLYISDIYPYCHKRYSRGVEENGFKDKQTLKKNLAFKEQKARGFIDVNDFEDYDRKAAHLVSNIDKDYVWPDNFKNSVFNNKYPINIHIAQTLIGVRGWTSIKTP